MTLSRRQAASLGGRARSAKLPPERRSEIAHAGGRATAAKKRPAAIEALIESLVEAAPELTAEQRERLRSIFAPVVVDGEAAQR